ncbi:hypothetical protein RIF25_11380 [Thermosynechococcaceae cyanobacterium BACA0444]|uniref:Uncharacterized protein n=1 Tax=Pseudocalidococcus azoricus BACA0444 TaxID=2918990 RepID=A0AAE4FSA9_9CYAN|nr:hypothetical protein [Pseudocalidococcus azoricus]MDS3861408.1 hypothetical protein [Pseudocalidococcus azoricus BACA0444]
MNYCDWRQDIFDTPPKINPLVWELRDETYCLSPGQTLDFIDQALVDPEIPQLFTKEQIGIGLQLLFSNACGNAVFSYLETPDHQRKVTAIENLKYLYQNYFNPLCQAPLKWIGHDLDDGPIGYLCYMFWDIFVLYPGHQSISVEMTDAALTVMAEALCFKNDQVIVSALHGLGHWVNYASKAQEIIHQWQLQPTTENQAVLIYAHQAWSGCVQ